MAVLIPRAIRTTLLPIAITRPITATSGAATAIGSGRGIQSFVVDRGPIERLRRSAVVVDLSRAAAEALDFVRAGHAPVRIAPAG